MDTGGSRPLLYPSPKNGNRLPMRTRGERIGGRKKGTPNRSRPGGVPTWRVSEKLG
jgi:hypothetical protein